MVETPVSSLRSDDFGYSGFEHVLKSTTAAVLAGPFGAAGAGGAGGAGGARLISVVAGFACVVLAITFCCGGGVCTCTSTGGMNGGGGAFISGGGGGGGVSGGGGGFTSSTILVSHCLGHLGDHSLAETSNDPVSNDQVQDDDNGDTSDIFPGVLLMRKIHPAFSNTNLFCCYQNPQDTERKLKQPHPS
ncbi:hypothetical protein [Massilia sp. WF1]|uniref:hypothetical protein n=1 Tax=Massilia sp. WF1 TaxID=1406431 RepID=UPI0027D89AE2|nr:hypothetical protein [Massilia sp. WF1]